MDIIHECLRLAPVPGLAPAFQTLRSIWSYVEQSRSCERLLVRVRSLAQSIARLLAALNEECRIGRPPYILTLKPLADLHGLVMFALEPGPYSHQPL